MILKSAESENSNLKSLNLPFYNFLETFLRIRVIEISKCSFQTR